MLVKVNVNSESLCCISAAVYFIVSFLNISEPCSQLSSQFTRILLCLLRTPFFSTELTDKGHNWAVMLSFGGVNSHNYFFIIMHDQIASVYLIIKKETTLLLLSVLFPEVNLLL